MPSHVSQGSHAGQKSPGACLGHLWKVTIMRMLIQVWCIACTHPRSSSVTAFWQLYLAKRGLL